MKNHILHVIVWAMLILKSASNLDAEPRALIIYPGVPRIHPGESLVRPSFDRLIPTTRPVTHPGASTIYPGADLIRPVDLPLIPKCIP